MLLPPRRQLRLRLQKKQLLLLPSPSQRRLRLRNQQPHLLVLGLCLEENLVEEFSPKKKLAPIF
jgi:hypothetical protein